MKKIASLLMSLVLVICCFSTATYAATTEYALVRAPGGDYGLEGNFKLPTLVSGWDSGTNATNKINFELWLPVNNSTDWLELGYKHGNKADGTSNYAFYNGFFKSKYVNGVYGYGSLNKSFSVGTTYTFEIVDVNKAGLWEIYIGSTYFGSFADTVGLSTTSNTHDLGFEITKNSSAMSISDTTITNLKYYNGSSWKTLNNKTVSTSNSSSLVNASYNSSTNVATFR